MPERLFESPSTRQADPRRLLEVVEREIAELVSRTRSAELREGTLRTALEESEHARECLEETCAARMRFLNLVSHEVRTPLHVVQMQLQLLEREPLTARGLKLLDITLRSFRELTTLVDSLMDFSRAENLRRTATPTAVAPGNLLRDLAAAMGLEAERRGLEVRVRDLVGRPLETDRRLLRVVLRNLLENALKYTQEGCITMVAEESDQGVRIRISDTGPGIPEQHRVLIFEPFERVQDRGVQGSGLGLAIVRDLVDALGGSITLESQVGVGSTFTVTLPWQWVQDAGNC